MVQALGASLASASLTAQATTLPRCTFAVGSSLLALSLVPTATGDSHVLLLSDEGSQVNLVRHDTAHKIGAYPGQPWEMHLQVVGDKFRPIHTRLYNILLKDKDGKTRAIVAAGVDSITTVTHCPDLRRAREVFPDIKDSTLQQPQGEVEILLRACDAGLLPFGGVIRGNLRLEHSPWGEGKVLQGSHEEIQFPPTTQLASGAMVLSQGLMLMLTGGSGFRYAAGHATAGHPPEAKHPFNETRDLPDFWEEEELGPHRPPPTADTGTAQGAGAL